MTITRLWETGWEWGVNDLESVVDGVPSAPSTLAPKSGSYALPMAANRDIYAETFPFLSQSRAALHVRHGILTIGACDLMGLYSGTTALVRVQYNMETLEWTVLCGATLVATEYDRDFARQASYFHVGMDAKIDAAAGWVYLYVDGVQRVAYDGQTNQGGTEFDILLLSAPDTKTWGSNAFIDDCYWDNTTGELAPAAPPDLRFDMVAPNGDGNYSQFTGSDGNSVNNSLLVDEVPYSSTDYVYPDSTGEKDSYAAATVTLVGDEAIAAVIVNAIAAKENASSPLNLKLGTRYSATDSVGSAQVIGTHLTLYRERQTTKPGGGAWDQASLSGVELLLEAS